MFVAIIEQFGFSFLGSNLLSSPIALVAGALSFANSRHSDQSGERYRHILLPSCAVALSFFLQAIAMNSGNRGFEFFCLFMNACASCVIAPALALLARYLSPLSPAFSMCSVCFAHIAF
jgi:hypothetical protein